MFTTVFATTAELWGWPYWHRDWSFCFRKKETVPGRSLRQAEQFWHCCGRMGFCLRLSHCLSLLPQICDKMDYVAGEAYVRYCCFFFWSCRNFIWHGSGQAIPWFPPGMRNYWNDMEMEIKMNEFITSSLKGFYPYFAIPAFIIVIYRVRKKLWTRSESLLLLFVILHLVFEALQILIGARTLYMSRRYLLPCAPLLFG